MSEVLVTGASGFVGRRLCAALGDRHRVRALLRTATGGPWHSVHLADLGRDAVPDEALAGVDIVYHLAGLTHDAAARGDEAEYERVNVTGTRALLAAARRHGVRRFVLMSSVKAMGEGTRAAQNETALPRPSSAYGRTKLAAEELVRGGDWTPEWVVLRPALVYGPGVGGNLAGMIAAIDAGKFPPVPRVDNRRSLVHVDDLVAATVLCGDAGAAAGQTFLVTDGEQYSTRRIYEAIAHALGRDIPPWSVPLAALRALALGGDAARRVSRRRPPFDSGAFRKLFGSACYDASRITAVVGFQPRRTLERALPAIVEAWRAGQ